MPEETEKKHSYAVHTIGGEKLQIRASKFRIKEDENRIYFDDVDESEDGQWTVFLSGIAAIHREPEIQIPIVAPVVLEQRNEFR